MFPFLIDIFIFIYIKNKILCDKNLTSISILPLGSASYTMSDCFAKTATLDTNSVAGFALGGAFAPGGGFIQFETTTTTTTTTTLVADAVVTCSDNDGATSNATVAFAGCTVSRLVLPRTTYCGFLLIVVIARVRERTRERENERKRELEGGRNGG